MESMGTRLKFAREAAGFKSARSAAIGFDWKPSTYAAHENGQNDFDADIARIYGKAFKTSGAWLLTGEGSAPKPKKGGTPFISSFDPDAIDDPHDSEAEPSAINFPSDAIKELAARAGMGSGQSVASVSTYKGEKNTHRDAILDDYWRLPPSYIRETLGSRVIDLLVVTCLGNSMEPTLKAGDRVIVDTSVKEPTIDGIYAIRNGVDEIVVKTLKIVGRNPPRVRVVSDNPTFAAEEYAWGEVPIVGRVVAGIKLF